MLFTKFNHLFIFSPAVDSDFSASPTSVQSFSATSFLPQTASSNSIYLTINKQITADTQKHRFIERAPKDITGAAFEAVFSEIEIFSAD